LGQYFWRSGQRGVGERGVFYGLARRHHNFSAGDLACKPLPARSGHIPSSFTLRRPSCFGKRGLAGLAEGFWPVLERRLHGVIGNLAACKTASASSLGVQSFPSN
jgi:hypothetical protein